MALQRADPGRFHAGGSAPDHGHPHRAHGRGDLELLFPAQGDVDAAGDRVRHVVAAGEAAVVAADAGPDVLRPAFFRLERPLRVGPERPAQTDEVALAFGQDALGQIGQVDGARGDHGSLTTFFTASAAHTLWARDIPMGLTSWMVVWWMPPDMWMAATPRASSRLESSMVSSIVCPPGS